MGTVSIQGSVGFNGKNKSSDVIAVKTRLVELGFDWLDPNETKVGPLTIKTIKLFQAIKNGYDVVNSKSDGIIDVGKDTHNWLNAKNSPHWVRMPAGSKEEGFVNREVNDFSDNHDYGTDWLADTLTEAGAQYKSDYLDSNPNAALLTFNDASIPQGGNTPSHAGHETGLVIDVYLPRKDGKAGGTVVGNSNYDRKAMRAMIKAFLDQPLADRVFLNDSVLINEGLCRWVSGHDNHAHFEILPPKREM